MLSTNDNVTACEVSYIFRIFKTLICKIWKTNILPVRLSDCIKHTLYSKGEECKVGERVCFENYLHLTRHYAIRIPYILWRVSRCLGSKIIFDFHMSVHRKNISKVQPTRLPFSLFICFYKLLYMFQAVSPPIIRSTKLYIQRQVL